MIQRPDHEPARTFQEPNKLWDNASLHARSLGCETCLERSICGGVHTDAGVFDCNDLCTCKDRTSCDMVCRSKPQHFVAFMREVNGLDLNNTPRVAPVSSQPLPAVVPLIDHRSSRESVLQESIVGLSLYDLVDFSTGRTRATSRRWLSERFLIPGNTRIVLTGVEKDPKLERWWRLADRPSVLKELAALGIDLITAPNFSVLSDVPRTDNLHAMKRILISWCEIMDAGIPAALHLNARTEHDYSRWTTLIKARPEIELVAFEFATGCGRGDRLAWHVHQLCRLADEVGRPLILVMRGGTRAREALKQHFAAISLLETDAFARTMRRREAYHLPSGQLKWRKHPTERGAPLDDLLARNIETVRRTYTEEGKVNLPAPRRQPARRGAPDCNSKTIEPSLLSKLDLPRQARAVSADRHRPIPAAKP